jgi:hypothetical protein
MKDKRQAYDFEVQTRNEEGSLRTFPTLADAMEYAAKDKSVWKISFTIHTGERIRLVAFEVNNVGSISWVYEPILTIIKPNHEA